MPLTGVYAWKEDGLSPDERVDRFFNLIDHAVENGVPLQELYRREHLKEFLFFLLRRYDEPCATCTLRTTKGSKMPKLTLTSTFASTVMVGDPGYLTIPLAPKETKTVDVTDVQLRQLTPGLDKLKTAGWLKYAVDASGAPAKAEVKPAPAEPPKPPPPPPPAPEPEPAPAAPTPVEPEAVAADSDAKSEEPPAPEAPPSAPKSSPFDRKNRNR